MRQAASQGSSVPTSDGSNRHQSRNTSKGQEVRILLTREHFKGGEEGDSHYIYSWPKANPKNWIIDLTKLGDQIETATATDYAEEGPKNIWTILATRSDVPQKTPLDILSLTFSDEGYGPVQLSLKKEHPLPEEYVQIVLGPGDGCGPDGPACEPNDP